MRSVQQEQGSKMSHMQLTIDEKDHELKTTHGDLVGFLFIFTRTKVILSSLYPFFSQNVHKWIHSSVVYKRTSMYLDIIHFYHFLLR